MVREGIARKRFKPTAFHIPGIDMIRNNGGFTLMGVLVLVTISGIGLMGASQCWRTIAQREREEALLFRGDQIRKAIESYYMAGAGGAAGGKYPRRMEDLLKDPRFGAVRRHLRKIYRNPIDEKGKWELIRDGAGRIKGVYGKSEEKPLKRSEFDISYSEFENAETYTDWKFVFVPKAAGSKASTPSTAGETG